MNIQTAAIVTKPRQPEVAQVAAELIDWFQTRRIAAYVDMEAAELMNRPGCGREPERLAAEADLVVVVGGDGTLLSAARMIGERETPILAINHGSLGFLTEVRLEEMYPALQMVLEGRFVTESRMRIDMAVVRDDQSVAQYRALNDVVINKGTLARIIELEASVDGQYVTSFRSDGLIIATPTGSTAYNLSAGGPIIFPTMTAMVMTPICSHTLTNRPIVLPSGVRIEITLKSTQGEVYVTVDGQVGLPLEAGDKLTVRESNTAVKLISPAGKNYFDVLRGKLKWG